MKIKLIVISIMLSVVFLCTPFFTNAQEIRVTNIEDIEKEGDNDEIMPRIYWSGSAYLTERTWCNITSSNNLFPDRPLVTSDANNTGNVFIRVVNSSGAIVGNTYIVSPGNSIRLDSIPANSGTYTIQGYAVYSGIYYFSID